MKPKKSKKVDTDRLRGLFFRTGLIIATGMVILAFQWKSNYETTQDISSNLIVDQDEEIIDITVQKPEPKPVTHFELQIVPDIDPEVPDTSDAFNVEVKPSDSIMPLKILPADTEYVDDNEFFIVVEEYPEFVGGSAARHKYLRDHLDYPDLERDMGIEGAVYLNFIVEKDGSISHVKILHGVTPNINNEAIRVVKDMPNWRPGLQRKKPVRVSVNMDIRFQLAK